MYFAHMLCIFSMFVYVICLIPAPNKAAKSENKQDLSQGQVNSPDSALPIT